MSEERHTGKLHSAKDFLRSDSRRNTQYILAKQDGSNADFSFGYAPFYQQILNESKEILISEVTSAINKIENGPNEFCSFGIDNTNKNVTPIQYLPIDDLPGGSDIRRLLQNPELEERTYEDWPNPEYQLILVENPGSDTVVLGVQEYSDR